MNYTQQQVAKLLKSILPSATENEGSVTLTVKGVSIKYTKPNQNLTTTINNRTTTSFK